jgi:transcriptional regulator with XRE-family HTH domain
MLNARNCHPRGATVFEDLSARPQDVLRSNAECRCDPVLRASIGRRFREAREFHGFQQAEAAQRLGIQQDLLDEIEHAKHAPSTALLITASLTFGVAVDFLVGLSEDDDIDRSTLDRFAILRHLRHLVERQAATVVDATLFELQRDAEHAAHVRDVLNASRPVVAAVESEPTISTALQATAEGRVLLGAVQTLAEITRVAREWLDRQDRLAQRVIAKAAEQSSLSPTTFQPEQ